MIRELVKNDGEAFLNLLKNLDDETDFMLYEAGERDSSTKSVEESIESFKANGGNTFGLFIDNKLVGFTLLVRGQVNRTKHSGYIVLGILASQSGKNYGSKLISTIEKWATNQDIKRLELTVLSHNFRAVKLYEKCGFMIEGTKRNSMLIKNKLYDEYYMGKLL